VSMGALKGDAKGRAAYVRFKCKGNDIAFIGAYFPPKPGTRSELPKYLRTCHTIARWLADTLCSLPGQCNPMIYTDLNDGMGKYRMGEGAWKYQPTTAIAEHASRYERISEGAGTHRCADCVKHTNW